MLGLSLKHGQNHEGAAQQMEFLCRAPALLVRNVLGRQENTRVRLKGTGGGFVVKGGKLKALKG